MTETSIPNNETTPEAVTATPEEAQASTIAASEVPEHPFARIGEDGTVYVKDGDEERVIGGFPEGIPASPLRPVRAPLRRPRGHDQALRGSTRLPEPARHRSDSGDAA